MPSFGDVRITVDSREALKISIINVVADEASYPRLRIKKALRELQELLGDG